MSERITEVLILPDGMDEADVNASTFGLRVAWRGVYTDTGRGGYAVIRGLSHLSRAGRWRLQPEPRLQRHYRWPDIETALDVARAAVNDVRVNGHTWAEWKGRTQ